MSKSTEIKFRNRDGHVITTSRVPSEPADPPLAPPPKNYSHKSFKTVEGWIREIQNNREIQLAIERAGKGKTLLIQFTPEGILDHLLLNYPQDSTIGSFAHHLDSSLEGLTGFNRYLHKGDFLRESRIVLTKIFLGGLQRTT